MYTKLLMSISHYQIFVSFLRQYSINMFCTHFSDDRAYFFYIRDSSVVVHVDGVRECLRTAATNGSIVHPLCHK
jgi:hypothetical protein